MKLNEIQRQFKENYEKAPKTVYPLHESLQTRQQSIFELFELESSREQLNGLTVFLCIFLSLWMPR